MIRYCTLFDARYLSRGLALHRSLLRHAHDFRLHVLCLDDTTYRVLAALAPERLEAIALAELNAEDHELSAVRPERTPQEYYFTCKASLLRLLLARHPDTERLSYFDSDLYFFGDPGLMLRECEAAPVALSPHRFTPHNVNRAQFGLFNAGWVSVGTDPVARRFVAWWRERCLEWCRMEVQAARFADQKYLDRVPELFEGARAVHHPGVNLAPWNLDPSTIRLSGDRVAVDGQPLVFFHFHGLLDLPLGFVDCALAHYGVLLTPEIKEGIYRPYARELAAARSQIRRVRPRPAAPSGPGPARPFVGLARALRRKDALRAA